MPINSYLTPGFIGLPWRKVGECCRRRGQTQPTVPTLSGDGARPTGYLILCDTPDKLTAFINKLNFQPNVEGQTHLVLSMI